MANQEELIRKSNWKPEGITSDLQVLTRYGSSTRGKSNVYFTGFPGDMEDSDKDFLKIISDDIFEGIKNWSIIRRLYLKFWIRSY